MAVGEYHGVKPFQTHPERLKAEIRSSVDDRGFSVMDSGRTKRRKRLSRGSLEVQTLQWQVRVGTPMEVPEPSTVSSSRESVLAGRAGPSNYVWDLTLSCMAAAVAALVISMAGPAFQVSKDIRKGARLSSGARLPSVFSRRTSSMSIISRAPSRSSMG